MSDVGARGNRLGALKEFACHVEAGAPRVWAALTDPEQTRRYLHGLELCSAWTPEAPIDIRHRGRVALSGRVLCVRPFTRLSYLLDSGPGDPPTYLTWLVRPSGAGCVVRLAIDQTDDADSVVEAEDAWLPVLASLQRLFAPR